MKKRTIMVVDDNWEVVETIAAGLKKMTQNYELINAANGNMACKIAVSQNPDMIIMDWDMPVMNGIDALRQLKSMEDTQEIPVIIASGKMTTSENLRTALDVGAIDYIRKPIDFVELEARVNAAFNIKQKNEDIKQLMQKELESRSRELSTTSVLMMEKNNFLHQTRESINKTLTSHASDSSIRTALNSIVKSIEKNLEGENRWRIFKQHFEAVHTGFFNSLIESFNDISQKDLRLCAYLKLGMENKEIAQLLNIAPESVSKAFYRLKLKLKLDREADLRAFIVKL